VDGVEILTPAVTAATWVLIAGAVVLAVIVGGALLIVLAATRERSRPVRLPKRLRIGGDHPDPVSDPEEGEVRG
jgi:hypothetical protein